MGPVIISTMTIKWNRRLTERLFNNDSRILWRIINNGRSNIISVLRRRLKLSTSSNLPTLLLDVLEESLDSVVLHLVLNRAMTGFFGGTVAEFVVLDVLDYCVAELFVDGFVDVDAFDIEADLA